MAERTYVVSSSNSDPHVVVRLGFPKQRPSDGRFECAVEIDKGTTCYTRYMNGVDALEALQLAIVMIGTRLKGINDDSPEPLTWMRGERTDLGVPTYPDYSLNPIMEPKGR